MNGILGFVNEILSFVNGILGKMNGMLGKMNGILEFVNGGRRFVGEKMRKNEQRVLDYLYKKFVVNRFQLIFK